MRFAAAIIIFTLTIPAFAQRIFCDPRKERCPGYGHRSTETPSYASKSSRINLNPSSVPLEAGFGFEAIAYRGDFDFSIAQGNGRIGAAISPSNSEETFFGPPGFEPDAIYLDRKLDAKKFVSQKLTLATAFSVVDNQRDDIWKFGLNIGVMAKQNKRTGSIWGGGGISGVMGPLTYGWARSNDEYFIDYTPLGLDQTEKLRYANETYSLGFALSSLILDYSRLKITLQDERIYSTDLLTATLTLRRWLFTVAQRTENSDRPYFNPASRSLETKKIKNEPFCGIQASFTESFMMGMFYNYYLLREVSFGMTIFL